MKITNRSLLTGKVRTLEINVTQEQIDNWRNGTLIQNAMPNLSPEEREFFISGTTQEEWDTLVEDKENENE